MPPSQTPFLAVIGGGNIAQAILLGPGTDTTLHRAAVVLAEPDAAKRERFRSIAATVVPTAVEAMQWLQREEQPRGAGQILLAVKPQVFDTVAAELSPLLSRETARRIVISVMAGMPSARIHDRLGGRIAVVRAMPNLPIRVRQGMTALALGTGAGRGDDSFASEVFSGFGRCVTIDESLMDAFTAVAGSGPAYLFYLAEAMTRAAVEVGFDPATADRIVRQTLAGAGAMFAESPESAVALRGIVTSKGGTTEAATRVLDTERITDAFVRAIVAARDRGRDLAG